MRKAAAESKSITATTYKRKKEILKQQGAGVKTHINVQDRTHFSCFKFVSLFVKTAREWYSQFMVLLTSANFHILVLVILATKKLPRPHLNNRNTLGLMKFDEENSSISRHKGNQSWIRILNYILMKTFSRRNGKRKYHYRRGGIIIFDLFDTFLRCWCFPTCSQHYFFSVMSVIWGLVPQTCSDGGLGQVLFHVSLSRLFLVLFIWFLTSRRNVEWYRKAETLYFFWCLNRAWHLIQKRASQLHFINERIHRWARNPNRRWCRSEWVMMEG